MILRKIYRSHSNYIFGCHDNTFVKVRGILLSIYHYVAVMSNCVDVKGRGFTIEHAW